MGLYDDVLARAREQEAMAAIAVPTAKATQYGAARGMARAKQGVNQMFGIEEPAVIAAKAAEARNVKLQGIVSKYANASTRGDFTAAFSELMANGFPEEAAKIQEHLKNMPKPKEYSDIEGYKLAKQQGYEGTFVQYQIDLKKAQADSTTMLPTPAKGFMYEQDESGNWKSIVIPGGSADLEIQEQERANIQAKINKQNDASVVLKNVNLVRDAIANPDTFFGIKVGGTGWGALLKDIPASQAKGVEGMIKTMKGNIGFAKLQAMREASPTGGALGQVSNIELELLTGVIGSLDQAQSDEDLLRVLDQIEYTYNIIVHGQATAPSPANVSSTPPLNPDDPLGVL